MPETDIFANERPTLKTIANLAGLSVASVSRALKDAPDIGEDTKVRVRGIAQQIGYRPNRAGVRLRTGRTNVIALVLSTEADVMNHTAQMIYSIAAALRGTAYHLVVMPYFGDEDPMSPIRYIVETGSADGIVLNQIMPDDPRVRYMSDHGFPFTAHGRTNMDLAHPYFDFDNEAFARLGVRALAQRGRRKLMLVAPPREHSYAGHMIKGFVEECTRLNLHYAIEQRVTSDAFFGQVEDAVHHRFAQPDRPDGILLGSTTAAMAAVTGAERSGLRIGTDFDVAAKEAITFLHRFRKEIIVVHEDVSKAGDFLARALMAAIEHRPHDQGQYLDTPIKIFTEDQS